MASSAEAAAGGDLGADESRRAAPPSGRVIPAVCRPPCFLAAINTVKIG